MEGESRDAELLGGVRPHEDPHAAVVERLEEDFKDVDAYVCGPPPMVEAAQALLMGKGVPESRIYFDKFTTTESEETTRA